MRSPGEDGGSVPGVCGSVKYLQVHDTPMKQWPHRTRSFLTSVNLDPCQKHLPQFSMTLATQEASILTHGSGTSLQTFLVRVKIDTRQNPVWPPLEYTRASTGGSTARRGETVVSARGTLVDPDR